MIKKANQYGGNMEKIRMQSVNLQKANAVMAEVKKAVIGKDTCILKVMAAMIAGFLTNIVLFRSNKIGHFTT